MASKRTIAVVTGSRAEFGLLEPVMRAIDKHKKLELCCIVAGGHLLRGTWRDIQAAGFDIAARVPMQKRGQVGRGADVAAIGRGVSGFGRAFAHVKPHIVVILGDRVEAFAAATAASVGGIPLAHIHGGDRGEGIADEAMRHAISKMAHIHLPATAQSRQRLLRMGEDARWVFNVGSPAIDGLRQMRRCGDGPHRRKPQIIVMQHPIGACDDLERQWMTQTLQAVRSVNGSQPLILAPNDDPGSAGIRQALAATAVEDHIPRHEFVCLLAGARALVGNSSAGLIEAAALRVPAVNIGPRQAGRQKPGNVIDCDYGEKRVRAAVKKAMKAELRGLRQPYGDGRAGPRIADLLAKIPLAKVPLSKRNSY